LNAVFISLLLSAVALGTPLLLAALGEVVGEKSGVLNVGLEGMMLMGAFAGAAASMGTGNGFAGVVAAMAAGMLLSSIFAFLVVQGRADAVVAGTGLNLFALGLTGVAFRGLSNRFPDARVVKVPEPAFWVFALVICFLVSWTLSSTRLGLQIRACGENPQAAESAGISVAKTRWGCTLWNGALCGLAGAFLSISHTDSFAENMTAGRGFIALALVIFGRWNAWGALGAALLFGAAEGSQFWLQTRIATAWYPLLLALPYVLTLLVLSGFAGSVRAPAALGQNETEQ
jgi:simple sugar transport system permease protein